MSENTPASDAPWSDPDEAPEWGGETFARAELADGETQLRPATGTLTRRGRPRSLDPKRLITLRLDGDVIDRWRASGPGWQTRINAVLKAALAAQR